MKQLSKEVEAFVFFTMLFFSPKIGSYLDLSLITGLLMILISGSGMIKISKLSRRLVFLIIFMVVYDLIISAINLTIDVTFVGRMIRSLISVIAIEMYLKSRKINRLEALGLLSNVLLIQAILVILTSTIFVSWQENLRIISSFATHVRKYRSTGLLTGFDISGLVCVLGLIFTVSCRKTGVIELLKIISFIVATFFTSRFSLVFLFVVLTFYVILTFKNRSKRLLRFVFIIASILCALFAFTLFASTSKNHLLMISLPENLSWINEIVDKIQVAYASSDIEDGFMRNWNMPSDPLGQIFGLGTYGGGDIGYVRMVNSTGIIGLLFTIYWHFYLFRSSLSLDIKIKELKKEHVFIVASFLFVIVFMDFKNCYFFTSTFFEIMMIYMLSSIKDCDQKEESKGVEYERVSKHYSACF